MGRYSNCAELNPVQEYTNRITISIGYSKGEETENPNMFCSVVRNTLCVRHSNNFAKLSPE